ncbi:MAG TPA: hypothetical protein VFQ12_09050 [Thermoleophilaceae bacterium]|nr:hypothetical protein [Thermoleophilaceae bacterium]
MLEPLPFALHATSFDPGHAELALSLACAFGPVDPREVDDAVDRFAAALPQRARPQPLEELAALSALIRRGPWPKTIPTAGPTGLLLPSVLAGAPAHPLALAVLVAEVADRRGIPVGVVSNGSDHLNAHSALEEPLLLSPDSGVIVDARELPPPLTWRCSHETCGLLIDQLEPLWLRHGRIDQALLTAELRLCLPFQERAMAHAQRRLEHVRALLN